MARRGCKQPPAHMVPIQAERSCQKARELGHQEDRPTAQRRPPQGSWQAWEVWAAPEPIHSYACRQPESGSASVLAPHGAGPHLMSPPAAPPLGHLWPFLSGSVYVPLASQPGHLHPESALCLGSRRRRAALVPSPRAVGSGQGQGQGQSWPQNLLHRRHHTLLDTFREPGESDAQNAPGTQALD